MPYGSSQVVGLIEIDAESQTSVDHPLRPVARPRRQVSLARRDLSPPQDTNVVRANLWQINDDLRVELAAVIVRIANKQAR